MRKKEADTIPLVDAQIEADICDPIDILIESFVGHLLFAKIKEDFVRVLVALLFYEFSEIHDKPPW